MKIGIELRHVTLGSSGGVAILLQKVLVELFRLFPDDEFFVFCTIYNRNLLKNCPANVTFFSLPALSFFPEMGSLLKEKNIEVLFRSFPTFDSLYFPMAKQVFLIPDLQHEAFPEFFPPAILEERRASFIRVMSRAGAIGTLSQYARKTIVDHPENRCADIFMLQPALTEGDPCGDDVQLKPEEEALLPKGRYFYFPANLWAHKNHRRLFEAFQVFLRKSEATIELVLTGHPEGWEKLKAEFPDLPIRHLGFVRPGVVQLLYRNATALVFFSLYEGFGMPLLDAFAAGTPVICSNTTSLPEVGGEAVLTCDPLDIEAMSALMERIIRDEGLRTELIERGKARLKLFSWETSARNLREACQRVAQGVGNLPANFTQGPLVTIVTPSFNQGCFLKRTIESVLQQTYPHIEYLVMDGGSSDESVDILKEYGEQFSWVSEKDRGQTDAINKGFARAHGEILAYLNSDDVLEPEAVEKVVNFLLDHPEVDLVYGEANYIDKEDQVIGKYPTREYSFKHLTGEDFICQPAAFWRKRIAERVGPFDTRLHIVMDYDYWLRIAKAGGKIVHLHETLASSRLYAETKTLSRREDVFAEIMQISKRHLGYIHPNYFFGLWNHRIWERGEGIYKILQHIRGSLRLVALTHNLIENRAYYLHTVRPAWIKNQVRHLIKMTLGVFRPAARQWRRLRYQVNPKQAVFGLWQDNWLGPVAQVYIKRKNPGQALYLAGVPGDDMQVSVQVERISKKKLNLHKGQPIRIEVEAEPGQRISFAFSKAQKDAQGWYKSFLVTDTNLFAEHDVTY